MQLHPHMPVAFTSGGSGTGVSSVVNGACQIAATSRVMEPEEIEAAEHVSVHPIEHTVVLDGTAVIVRPSNPVERLTMEQSRAIFCGRITNWQDVGGPNKPIVVLSPEVNAGAHVYRQGARTRLRLRATSCREMPSRTASTSPPCRSRWSDSSGSASLACLAPLPRCC